MMEGEEPSVGRTPDTGHDLVVVGASAGGVEALREIARGLPGDLRAAVCVVLHLPTTAESMLPRILSRAGALPASHPGDGDPLEAGRIYVAPPDCHLLVKRGHVRVVRGPRENNHRPAIDPLFRTAALAYGRRAIGVILSGVLDDGVAGLRAIHARGGRTIVQDPADAVYAGMPASAIAGDSPDHVVPDTEIAGLVDRLVGEVVVLDEEKTLDDKLQLEADYAELELAAIERDDLPGERAPYSCPECGGALWDIGDEEPRFRCRIGHAYAPASLLEAHARHLDTALWTALRALEERSSMLRRIAGRLERKDLPHRVEQYAERALEAEAQAAVIREVLVGREGLSREEKTS
jgi:two-component system, chemotaxis family, protein-glutamate methylesterase/glutaminase